MKKIAGLDYIRSISAILIMLYHYTTRYFGRGSEDSKIGLWWGCWAVSVFFILSGFLTVYNLKDNMKVSEFLKKRFIRLYPGYFFCVIITTLFTLAFAAEKFIGFFPTLMNFTIIQSVFGFESVDGAYWTLLREIVFYFIIAFVLFIRYERYLDIFCTVWLAVTIVYVVSNKFVAFQPVVKALFAVFVLEEHAHTFIIGVSLCYLLKSGERKIFSYINLIVGMCVHFVRYGLMNALFITVCVLMIVLSVKTGFSFKYDKPLVFLAGISFPLYLLHQNIGYIIIEYISRIGFSYVTGVIVAIIFSILIASVTQYHFANTFGGFLKRRILK